MWKKPIGPWEGHLRGFRTGPPEIHRRLIAVSDRVYVTLGYGEPVSVLDGATGVTGGARVGRVALPSRSASRFVTAAAARSGQTVGMIDADIGLDSSGEP